MEEDLERVADMYRLAALDYCRVSMIRFERVGTPARYYGVFQKAEAKPVLESYDSGRLSVSARDFTASIQRVKSRIFDSERRDKPLLYEPPKRTF